MLILKRWDIRQLIGNEMRTMNNEERKQIDQAQQRANEENSITWCPNGCGQPVQYCMCDVMDEVAEMLKTKTVKRDDRTVDNYGNFTS